MQEKDLYKNYTLQEGLDKLDVVECFENPGQELRVGELFEKQRNYISTRLPRYEWMEI